MINRVDIKERAKEVFSQNYWKLVGIVLVGCLLAGAASILTTRFSSITDLLKGKKIETVSTSSNWSVLSLPYTIFVGNVISVGLAKICLAAYRGEEYEMRDLFYYFSGGRYMRVVGAMALCTLFVGIGLLLLIVPGIIAALGLSRVMYLLVDDPAISGMDAIRTSWEIMKGRKGEFFVFVLSFIGWLLLTVVTLGIVGVFYSNPYMDISLAGYHDELMKSSSTAEF